MIHHFNHHHHHLPLQFLSSINEGFKLDFGDFAIARTIARSTALNLEDLLD
ncbi:hypothetical protein LguiB_013665 [Lonicera macranthoides]